MWKLEDYHATNIEYGEQRDLVQTVVYMPLDSSTRLLSPSAVPEAFDINNLEPKHADVGVHQQLESPLEVINLSLLGFPSHQQTRSELTTPLSECHTP